MSLPETLSEGERAWIPEINYFRKSEPESGNGDFLAGEINHGFWRDSISDCIISVQGYHWEKPESVDKEPMTLDSKFLTLLQSLDSDFY